MPTKPCMKMYTVTIDKADGVCRHRFLGAGLCWIKPEKGVYASGGVPNVGPAEVEAGKDHEGEEIGTDCLAARQFGIWQQ